MAAPTRLVTHALPIKHSMSLMSLSLLLVTGTWDAVDNVSLVFLCTVLPGLDAQRARPGSACYLRQTRQPLQPPKECTVQYAW